jgi:hypothetical protein
MNDTSILVGIAAVSVCLAGTAIFQPKIAVSMAESVRAENGTSLAAVRPSWLAEGRQRRPIDSAAEWGRTLYSEKEIQESRR